MNRDEFLEFLTDVAKGVLWDAGRVGHLVLSQRDGYPEGRMREPEMRHAFSQECERRQILYAIEVPTRHQYRFTDTPGAGTVSARHDLVLLERDGATRAILIELKAGQPAMEQDDCGTSIDCRAISKDLQKLLREPASQGVCMFHVLYAMDRRTLATLLEKYTVALRRAIEHVQEPCAAGRRWFVLAILVQHQRGVHDEPAVLFRQAIDEFPPRAIDEQWSFAEGDLTRARW